MTIILNLAKELSILGSKPDAHPRFDVQPIPGVVEVLQILMEDYDELPIFLSVADTQILCISYLWKENDIQPGKKAEMMEEMLEMNIPMPLSSFAKIGDQYVIFGALSTKASTDDIIYELEMLTNNTLAVIKEMAEYLQ